MQQEQEKQPQSEVDEVTPESSAEKVKIPETKKSNVDINEELPRIENKQYIDSSNVEIDQEKVKLMENSINNALLHIFEKHPNINAEIIEGLISKFEMRGKEKNDQGAGYNDIAYFDFIEHKVILRPELFDKNEKGEYKFDFEHAIYHEIGHAFSGERNLIYNDDNIKSILIKSEKEITEQDKNDTDWLREMLEKPAEFSGAQGRWIDLRLKELDVINKVTSLEDLQKLYTDEKIEKSSAEMELAKKDLGKYKELKKQQVLNEIVAERTASYLESDGTEISMLAKHLERFSQEAIDKLKKDVPKEDYDEFAKAVKNKDNDKILAFSKKYPVFERMILENRAFYHRFNKKIKETDTESLKEIVNDNRDNDEDVMYGGMEPQYFNHDDAGMASGQKVGIFDWLVKIMEPINQATAGRG